MKQRDFCDDPGLPSRTVCSLAFDELFAAILITKWYICRMTMACDPSDWYRYRVAISHVSNEAHILPRGLQEIQACQERANTIQ